MTDLRKTLSILSLSIIALVAFSAGAQNLQSASNSANAHARLLAKQQRIEEQIKLDEATNYAQNIYEEIDEQDIEPELDIYTEGWDCGQVNAYKGAVIPATQDIDVSNYCMPHNGIVTSNFGWRPRFGRMHRGIDLGLHMGDTILAAFDGKVRLTKFERGGYGFYVIIRHDNGLETVYGHLSRFLVRPYQTVKAGTPIALGGSSGRSTGPHLHFETRFMGMAINPSTIFDFEEKEIVNDRFTFVKSSVERYNLASAYPKAKYKKGKSKSRRLASKSKSKKKSKKRRK